MSRAAPAPSRLLLFAAVALVTIAATPAAEMRAPAAYSPREWHEQDGLPAEELAGVAQDEAGFLWVATSSALARFDGTKFERQAPAQEIFPRGMHPAGGFPVIPANGNAGLAGSLSWHDGGWRFDPEPALAGKAARSAFRDPQGGIWIGCDDGTILHREGANFDLFPAPADLAGRRIPSFADDALGQIWVARSAQLFRVEGPNWIEVTLPGTEPELRIGSSGQGGIWVVGRTTLHRWQDGALTPVAELPRLAGAHFVQAILEDQHGHLWLGTRSQGVFRIAGGTVTRVPTSSEDVTGLCEDREGNIWVASNGGGLTRLRPKVHELFDESNGLKDNFSYTVVEAPGGAMWLANRDGGLARITDGTVDPISRREGWRSFSTMSLYPAPDGRLFITTGVGIHQLDTAAPRDPLRIPGLAAFRNVRASFVARNGDYWFSVDPDGAARWRDGEVIQFGPDHGLHAREVRAFAEDANGRIWIGGADGHLFRSVPDGFELVRFPGDSDCGALQVIRFEPDGSMLVGTTRRGVVIFPGGDLKQPRALDDSRGLPGSNISQLLIDDHDRYWFASRTGIFWVHGNEVRDFAVGRKEHVHAIALGQDDGVPYLSCHGLFQPAAWKAGDGSLWFATRRGVLRTDPSMMGLTSETPPPVTVSSIHADGRVIAPGSQVTLKSNVRKLEVTLSALNLSAPDSVQIRYRLDDFDPDWVVLGAGRTVTYPRLPPGEYVLNTMASHGSGRWSTQPGLITFRVTPPWWQTPAAQVGYLLTLIATVAFVVRRWSHRRLRLRLERAERARAIEQERARIARNIHDDVGANLTRISLLTQAAQHESTAPSATLDKIHEATRTITRAMDEIVWAVNPRHDNTESLVYYIGNFAQSLLGAAGIRCRLLTPEQLPAAPLTSQTRHHLFLCCKEALNNIVKHAQATEVTIRIAGERATLVVAISDNGTGMPERLGSDLGNPTTPVGRSGNGLRNLRERMAEIGGSCSMSRGNASGAVGPGTTVTFTVPLQTGWTS